MRMTLFMALLGAPFVLAGCASGGIEDVDVVGDDEECAVSAGLPATPPLLIINEFQAYGFEDPATGERDPDWVEVHCFDTYPVSLEGLSLWSDDGGDGDGQRPWEFPADAVLEPNTYLVVICDDRESTGTELHASFRLERNSGTLRLYFTEDGGDAALDIDSVEYGYQWEGRSCGRHPDAGQPWTATGSPTPGFANE